ncbi:MAG: hypothetical protein UY99_C0017G0025 [Parcubacteria group bacterium GW2011_GWA1_59_11]|nr:MAG: hypothetical protein UY99_C0017G0025 [Parcubacteria group bacterium GW2011_GWA1_59_11]
MPERIKIMIGLAGLLLITLAWFRFPAAEEAVAPAWPALTSEGGDVSVEVSPVFSSDVWRFDIALNTHSVELDEDIAASAALIADGRTVRPLAWTGDPPGGHHRTGSLEFAPLSPPPDSVELVLYGVGGAPERSFRWELNAQK